MVVVGFNGSKMTAYVKSGLRLYGGLLIDELKRTDNPNF